MFDCLRPVALGILSISIGHAGVLVTFFSPSSFNTNEATMNAALGITGYQITNFETTALPSGIKYSLAGGAPRSSLPNLFSVNDPSALGLAANDNWDGLNVLTNDTNNQFPGVGGGARIANSISFNLTGNVIGFGIGLSNFQSLGGPIQISNHDLLVNGVNLGTLETLAGGLWTAGLGRNAFLRIDGTGGTTINTVLFQVNTPGPTGDWLVFDHLAIQTALDNGSPTPEPSSFVLTIAGGILLAARKLRYR